MSNCVSTAFSPRFTAWNRMTATATISRMLVPLPSTPAYSGGRPRMGRAKIIPTTGTMMRRLFPISGTNKSSSLLLDLAAQTASRASSTWVNRKNSQNKTANTPRSNTLSNTSRTTFIPSSEFSFNSSGVAAK